MLFGAEGEPNRALVVVLHGDEGTPHKVAGLWRSVAARHDVVVFAPRCPKALGCAGSWWRWNQDPTWLLSQVDAMRERYAIDRQRQYLVGWSGGATYLGMQGHRWFDTFAAVVLAGGGAPGRDCWAKPACAPVYYLMGDRNPLFGLAESTRDYFTACGHEVRWDLRAGANHSMEWQALSQSRDDITTWLLSKKGECDDPVPAAAPSVTPQPREPAPSSEQVPAPPPAAPTPNCGCAVVPRASNATGWLGLMLLLLGRRIRRAYRGRVLNARWLALVCLVACSATPPPPPPEKEEPPRETLPVDSTDLCAIHCDRAEKCGIHRDACERDCPARGRSIAKMRGDFIGNMMLCLEGAACTGLQEGTAWDGCHSALVKTLPVSESLRRFCFESSRRAAQCKRANDADQMDCLTRFRFNNDTALEAARKCFTQPCPEVPTCMATALQR